MRWLLFLPLLLASCHGTTAHVGVGHSFEDAGGSWGGGCGPRGAWSQDDTTTLGFGLEVQLTPTTVIVENQAPSWLAAERLDPWVEPVPVAPDPIAPVLVLVDKLSAKLDTLSAKLDETAARIAKIENEVQNHISWKDIGVGTGAAGGLGLSSFAGLRAWQGRRRRKSRTVTEGNDDD